MIKPVKYLQWDKRWSTEDYSAPGEKCTIAEAGCGPTCMAMVVATLRDSSVTPSTTCAWSKKNKYKALNQGTYYSYFKAQGEAYNLKVAQLNATNAYHNPSAACHTQAIQELVDGNWLIACMGPGNWTKSGHFILVYAIDNGLVYINDPNSNSMSKEVAYISTFTNEVKYYFVVDLKEESTDMTEADVEKIVRKILRGEQTYPAAYAKTDWDEATVEGITDGTRPKGYATREEVIAMIKRTTRR